MSNWIRIDHDTYIDDSLVTCAEYQLFIDEMRAQGKYHQPDHWADYHFPKDHARQPILGVRPSDAVAFCEWLTRRNNDGWLYRLPSQQELHKDSILRTYHMKPIGYWSKSEENTGFVCVENKVQFINPIDIDKIFTFRNFIPDGKELCEWFLSRSLFPNNRLENLRQIRIKVIDFLNTFTPNKISAKDKLQDKLEVWKDTIKDFFLATFDLRKGQYRKWVYDRYKIIWLSHKARISIVDNVEKIFLEDFKNTVNAPQKLEQLEARIDGTSPAFEGIRLVKERIR
ncbi:MAG: SUMF1/EgtB/PvdO family nonheme iron enzyme [Anaerolineales bacterium]|jgi:hypothetical protein|nr:SUMF1/EgtB/PvdO family nonheme iron enzyme [Anaerolineales bacterium]